MLLSRNYAPSDDLAGYVRRYYVFQAALPEDFMLIDKLMSETAFIRVLLHGDWAAEAEPDAWRTYGQVLLMGPNAIPRRVRVKGGFLVVGVSILPSGWPALFSTSASAVADKVTSLVDHWGEQAERLHADVVHACDDTQIIGIIEALLRDRIRQLGGQAPVKAMAQFERVARNDSTIMVSQAAAQLGLSIRQLERQCHATFGHSPKVILRRSRFLDMVQAMRGFSEPSAEHLAALRYFDQSHRNREFRHFFGLTPGQFEKTQTPLFTAGLKFRAEGLN